MRHSRQRSTRFASTSLPPSDLGRTWCSSAASRDNVTPRSQTLASGGGGVAGQATAPEAGEEATGALTGHVVMDCLQGPGMWYKASGRMWFPGPRAGACRRRRGMNCTARSVRTRAPTLPGQGRGMESKVAGATIWVVTYGTRWLDLLARRLLPTIGHHFLTASLGWGSPSPANQVQGYRYHC